MTYEPMDMPETEDVVEERDFGGFSGGYTGDLKEGQLYPATLTKIMQRRVKSQYSDDADGKDWAVIWTFSVESPKEDVEVLTSEATGEKSKAGPMLIALVGRARYEERHRKTIAKDELVGRDCSVAVMFSKSGYPNVQAVFPPQATQKPETAPSATPTPTAPQEPPSTLQEAPLPEWER